MVYFISDGNGFIKIGVAYDIHKRLSSLQTGNARKLIVLKQVETSGMRIKGKHLTDYRIETALHNYFNEYRVFHEGASTEWFKEDAILPILERKDEELILFIKDLLIACPNIETKSFHEQDSYGDLKLKYELSQNRCEKYRAEIKSLKSTIERLEKSRDMLFKKQLKERDNEIIRLKNEINYLSGRKKGEVINAETTFNKNV